MLRLDGLTATADPRNASFARITAATPEGEATKLEMGVDWRAHELRNRCPSGRSSTLTTPSPTRSALFGRAENRDYIDVGAIITSGRYTEEDLLALAEALADISGRPDRVFLPYGLDPEQVAALKKHMTDWAARIRDATPQ